MLHALINARPPLLATTQQSQQAQQLQVILQQVEHFYGEGWHSMEASNALMGVVITAVLLVIAGVLGVVVPYLINTNAEKQMKKRIKNAQADLKSQLELMKSELGAIKKKIENSMENTMKQMTYRNLGDYAYKMAISSLEKLPPNTDERTMLPMAVTALLEATLYYALASAEAQFNAAKQTAEAKINELRKTQPDYNWQQRADSFIKFMENEIKNCTISDYHMPTWAKAGLDDLVAKLRAK